MEPIWKDKYGMSLIRPDIAVSEIVGNMLILTITIMAISTILLYALPNIQKLQDMAAVKQAEQAFAVIDYRTSKVSIGETPSQSIDMDLEGGFLAVMPNGTGKESYMTIRSSNNTFNIVVPMGKLRYSLEDRAVGYEGGGIWSKYPSGSVMLSSPEFHFDGDTLTLPVVNISGTDNQGGRGIATVSLEKGPMTVLFPTGGNRANPLNYSASGKIFVNITSDYYDAWADYARSLLYARIINTNKTTRTVQIELRVVPEGFGGATLIANPIKMRGLPERKNALKNFSFKIYPDINKKDGSYVLNWDIRSKSDGRALIFFLKKIPPDKAELQIGYKDFSIRPKMGDPDETWGGAIYSLQEDDNGKYLDIDLLDKNMYLNYSFQLVGSNNPIGCQIMAGDKISGIANPDYSWDDIVISTTNANRIQSLYNLTQHYISKMTDIEFYQCYPKSGDPRIPPSSLLIDYDVEGDITFLHVTDNRVKVMIR